MSTRPRARKPRTSEKPADLRAERETFVRSFLHKGVELTEDLIQDNRRLEQRVRELEDDNTRLRAQLKSNDAIRELLSKIEALEVERRALLDRSTELARAAEQTAARHDAAEVELNDLASLYVASFQLSGTLSVKRVVRHVCELLEQLVGAEAFIVYVVSEDGTCAVPIGSCGVDPGELSGVPLDDGALADACLTGLMRMQDAPGTRSEGRPVALIPLVFDSEVVGIISIRHLLPHKTAWARVDRELFKLLSVHGAAALIAANLYAKESGPRACLRDVQQRLMSQSRGPEVEVLDVVDP